MRADWKSIARRAGFQISGANSIRVKLEGERAQVVHVDMDPGGEAIAIWSIIAKRAVVEAAAGDDPTEHYAWARNRFSDLIGFTIDGNGRLIGESWIPTAGLTADEFKLYVRELARISDWHEFRLLGRDVN